MMKKKILLKFCSLISALMLSFVFVSDLNWGNAGAASEERKYWKYDYKTRKVTEYTISISDTFNAYDVETFSNNSGYSDNYDSRIVRCAGSGFIIGKHTIVTNAHCVFDNEKALFQTIADRFYGDTEVYACEYPKNLPVEYKLTISSIHVPQDYMTYQYPGDFDYAIFVVEEDLSSYGCFNLGVILEGAPMGESGLELSLAGFPSAPIQKISHGKLQELGKYQIASTCTSMPGASGSPVYTTTSYDGEIYESVVAINRAHRSNDYDYSYGVRITLPVIAFLRQFENQK